MPITSMYPYNPQPMIPTAPEPYEVSDFLVQAGWTEAGSYNGPLTTSTCYTHPSYPGLYFFWYEAVCMETVKLLMAARRNLGLE